MADSKEEAQDRRLSASIASTKVAPQYMNELNRSPAPPRARAAPRDRSGSASSPDRSRLRRCNDGGPGHERSSRAYRRGPVRYHPTLIPATLMIGHQFSISVFWNAASASARINTETRSISCLLRPTICRCHADLADWLDDQPVPGEGQPSFERHITGARPSVGDRVAE
jgi:hypothetical protein